MKAYPILLLLLVAVFVQGCISTPPSEVQIEFLVKSAVVETQTEALALMETALVAGEDELYDQARTVFLRMKQVWVSYEAGRMLFSSVMDQVEESKRELGEINESIG